MSDETEKRIADLERRVRELEAQPREQHFHYHQPVYQPPYVVPDTVPPMQPIMPNKVYIGDVPPWGTTTTPWIPNSTGTITWDGGHH